MNVSISSPIVVAAQSSTNIGWVGLAISLVLVFITVGVSLWRQLGLERSILWASFRALVQLLAVGSILGLLLDTGRPVILAWIWVAFMVCLSAFIVRQRVREVPGAGWLALVAIASSAAMGLGVLFGLGIFPVEGKTVVPLAGMIIGNAMASAVVVVRRIVSEVSENRAEIEARLALGQPWQEASRPYLRAALRTALIPSIERTKVVGLVALPGAMTGLILAGVAPASAVKIQAAVMFLVLGSEAMTLTVIALGLTRRLFTPDHRLRPLARTLT